MSEQTGGQASTDAQPEQQATAASAQVQDAATTLVDSAQTIANAVIDLGEEAAGTVLDAVIQANTLLGRALEGVRGQIGSKS